MTETVGYRQWLGVGSVLMLLVVLPACSKSSSTSPAGSTSLPAPTTTSSVVVPEEAPAEAASCETDTNSLEIALDAYQAEKGSFPSPPSAWSAATYAANYAPLTAATSGGPFLKSAPETRFYVIEYDSAGQIWVSPPGTYGPHNRGKDLTVTPNICQAAVG
jgi:hypothetical protein